MYFLTDPLCPWSWAMAPLVASVRTWTHVSFRSVLAPWLPSLAVKPAEAAKAEWAEAARVTGARIDPSYWDRVKPVTGLVADAAVKAADFQGAGKGEGYLDALRHAIFEEGGDASDSTLLAGLADRAELKADLFRGDLGVGRFSAQEVVAALDPEMPLAESVAWFARRKMLRSWEALAEDIRNADRQKLGSPAFHVVRGKKEAVLKGGTTRDALEKAIRSMS